jgi:iron-sulfur cluster repair protein YtfE (RIC family)
MAAKQGTMHAWHNHEPALEGRILMDALKIFGQMHVEALSAFDRLERSESQEHAQLWENLRDDILKHEQLEEQFVYGPASRDMGATTAGTLEEVGTSTTESFHARHEEDVREAGQLIETIDALDVTDARLMDSLRQLRQALEQHISMEEEEFWPHLRTAWGEEKLAEAGEQIQSAEGPALLSQIRR